MLRHFLRNRKEFKKQKIKMQKLLNINAKKMLLNLRSNRKLKDYVKRRSVKFKD